MITSNRPVPAGPDPPDLLLLCDRMRIHERILPVAPGAVSVFVPVPFPRVGRQASFPLYISISHH